MEEYNRLHEQYLHKTEEELREIINPENGYTETARKVANDILLLGKNTWQKVENPTVSTTENGSNDAMLKILQMLGVLFLLVTVWPLGMYFLWKNKKFDMQFKMIETFCCLILWILLAGWGIHTIRTQPEKKYEETDSFQNETPMSDADLVESSPSEITLIKIEAEYEGSTKAGTILNDDNSGISVTGVYSDGTTEKLHNFEYGIEKPKTLKAGKTSTVTITYNDKEYDLKVKCTSKTDKTKVTKKPKTKVQKSKTKTFYYLKYGKLLDSNPRGGSDGKTLVIKAKIESNLTNRLTILQNFYDVADIIKNQGGNKFNSIDYWAVADMANGKEEKVISFTLSKNTIKKIYSEKILDNQIKMYANDLFIHQSLQ